ncbi:MAG: MerR family transcriptional regulator [Rhodospirillales bacterium]|nr:MerR family transcriptional regulator [Rhodospirillales bacterium]
MMATATMTMPDRRMEKSAHAFRTISEVATELDVPQHVLRFWESKFNQVRPLKRGGGRRYYRPEDIDLLRRIRSLLYDDGYTIKGVQRLLKEARGRLGMRETAVEPRLLDIETRAELPRTGPQPATDRPLSRVSARLDAAKRGEIEDVLSDLQGALSLLRKTLQTS